MTVPMYIAESAPPEMRGRLVTLNNVFITGGQLIASILDGAFSYDTEDGWRLVWGRKDQDELNTLRPRQDGRHFPDNIFKCIFLNENLCILMEILLKFVPRGPINNIPALFQIMAWRRPGNKPLSGPVMT